MKKTMVIKLLGTLAIGSGARGNVYRTIIGVPAGYNPGNRAGF